ncbi:MAG: TonB-dependent receptor [Runella slithyformis]|nr:MAG: TonB-dependent receptor [Runella slithyformis]TAF25312.1 MAG: TonB-dependent receptor [Runella slithyformis]TAF43656.1 MAG: TonB-dependent receptor [Runella slithyformis]
MNFQVLRKMRATIGLFGVIAALFMGIDASAQGVTTSSINGVVADGKGEVLPGATVVAVHTPSGTKYGTVTNEKGRYNFPAVRVGGPYKVTVTFIGFQEQSKNEVFADLGANSTVNVTLTEEGKQLQEVVVTGGRGIISGDRNGASTNIKRESFERLPTLSRSFTDFSALTPQAGPGFSFGGRSSLYNNFSIDGATSNNVFGLSALPGGQSNAQPISVDAIQELQVSLSPYDVSQGSFTGAGVNAVTRSGTNETQGSAYYFTRNQDFVNKKVGNATDPIPNFTNNNFGARLGGAIVKNKLFYFVNVERETRIDPAVLLPADGTDSQGRPYQQTSTELSRLQNFLTTTTTGKDWAFDPGTFNNFDVQTANTKFLVKLDWNISNNHKFTIRYNQMNSFRDIGPSGSGGFRPAPPGGRSNSNNTLPFSGIWYRINNNLKNVIAELNSTFGNGKFANNLQVGFSAFRDFREGQGGAESPNFPTVDIVGPNGQNLTAFGAEPFTPNNRLDQNIFQLNNKFDIFAGNHTFTVGTANEFYSFVNGFTPLVRGNYRFNSINDFIANVTNAPGTPNFVAPAAYAIQYSALQGVDAPLAEFKSAQYGFYAQDKYTGIRNVTITAGIRVDIPTFDGSRVIGNPVSDEMTFNNDEKIKVNQLPKSTPLWSPRIGFNWDLKGDKTIQLRGGTGIFTGRIPFVWISNQVSNTGAFFGTLQAEPSSTPPLSQVRFNPNPNAYVPPVTGTVASPAIPPAFTINATVPNFKFPQVWRTNFALDYKLPYGLIATGEFIYTKDVNAVFIRDANLSNPVGTVPGDGRPLFGAANGDAAQLPGPDRRVNDRVVQALMLDNISEGYSTSFTAQLQKTTGPITGSIAYTYTDSKDINGQSGSTAGGLFTGNSVVSTLNLPNLAFSNNVVPNRVNGFVSWRKEWVKNFLATSLSFIYTGFTGNNFTYNYVGNLNSDGYANKDLMYIPRNQNEIILAPANALDTRTPQEIWNQLDAYISQDEYLNSRRGQYAERNGAFAPWVDRLDMRLLIDITPFKVAGRNMTLQLSGEVQNFLNLLNTNWGLVKTPTRAQILSFAGYEVPHTAALPTTGRPVFTFPLNTNNTPVSQTFINNPGFGSRWQGQLGLRVSF